MSTRTKAVATAPALPSGADSPTVIAGYALTIAKALEYSGVDSRRVFAAAGIHEALRNDPLKRLSFDAVTRLYRVCVEVTGDPYFGLKVARLIQPSTMHALGYGLLASTTLMDFCGRVQRYFRLVSQTARVDVATRGEEVHLSSVPLVDVSPESQDAWAGILYRLMCLLYRDDFHPVAVELAHPMPDAGDEPYLEFFGAPVRFGCRAVTLVLPRSDMGVPLRGACPELAQFSDNLAASYIAKLDRADVVANVRARLVEQLPSGECNKAKVAAALGMSGSTLRQRLIDRGTSFHELLNDVRRELACGYLRQPGVSVTEITFLLGFTDVSNFTRAFKRWTGTSPTRFRQRG